MWTFVKRNNACHPYCSDNTIIFAVFISNKFVVQQSKIQPYILRIHRRVIMLEKLLRPHNKSDVPSPHP